jgi:hypothetical protein
MPLWSAQDHQRNEHDIRIKDFLAQHANDMECWLHLAFLTNHLRLVRLPPLQGLGHVMPHRTITSVRRDETSVCHLAATTTTPPRVPRSHVHVDTVHSSQCSSSSVCVYLHLMCPYAVLPYHARQASQHSQPLLPRLHAAHFAQRLSACLPVHESPPRRARGEQSLVRFSPPSSSSYSPVPARPLFCLWFSP